MSRDLSSFDPIVREHRCIGNKISNAPSWFEHDGRGIPLCCVCSECRTEKLSHYRPEILRPYSQNDVDEDIEPDGDDWDGDSGF